MDYLLDYLLEHLFIYFGESSYKSLVERWAKLNAGISRNVLFSNNFWCTGRSGNGINDPNPLISFAPEGLRYQDWSPEKAGMEKESSTKLQDCMLRFEYRKLSSSGRWMTPRTAARTQVALHCPLQSESPKGKEAGNLSHLELSHVGQQLPNCVLSLLTKGTLCATEVGICFCFWLSLLHLKTVLSASRQTQGKERARLGWLI